MEFIKYLYHRSIIASMVIAMVGIHTLCGQSISMSVVGGFGSTHPILESTLGEVSISSFEFNSITLQEGFHQGNLVFSTSAKVLPDLNVNIFPNPCAHELNIQLEYSSHVSAIIIDVAGRPVMKASLDIGGDTLNLASLHAGSYFLLLSAGNRQIYISKLTKV